MRDLNKECKNIPNHSNVDNKIDISGISKLVNEFISTIYISDLSQAIKSATECSKSLTSIIEKSDFKKTIATSSELIDSFNKLLTLNLSDISQTIKLATECSHAIDNLLIYEEVIKEEYTEEIVDQLINNVDSNEIAQNLEQKTGIKMETWLPIILMIIQTLLMIYSTFNQQPQEINNYHIEIHQQSSNEDINQITYDMNDQMDNNSNP